MISILFRFFVLITGLWLLRRILGRVFTPSKQSGAKDRKVATPNIMVKDPVCGMYMDSRLAVRLEDSDAQCYFCSEECKNKYLNRPEEAERTQSTSAM